MGKFHSACQLSLGSRLVLRPSPPTLAASLRSAASGGSETDKEGEIDGMNLKRSGEGDNRDNECRGEHQ